MVQYSKEERIKKINAQVKKYLYKLIIQHPQVLQYPIANDCLEVFIDGPSEPHLVPKLLLQLYVRELHNSMVSTPKAGGLKEARDADNNIIISDYKLQSILPLQRKKTSARYKVMCGCECFISAKSIHS